jgi:Fur family ferric uptake transcriptional regulator
VERRTQQREAIERALKEANRPLSPLEILRLAKELSPGMGIATVYRNVARMLESGSIRAVDIPGAKNRYETAGKAHHHHFHCERCDRVYEVEDCPGSLARLAPSGFLTRAHEIILFGLCRSCSASA